MMGTGPVAERLASRLIAEGWDGVMLGSDRQWLGAGVGGALGPARRAVPPACPARGTVDVSVLRRLSKGEISVDAAAQQLARL